MREYWNNEEDDDVDSVYSHQTGRSTRFQSFHDMEMNITED